MNQSAVFTHAVQQVLAPSEELHCPSTYYSDSNCTSTWLGKLQDHFGPEDALLQTLENEAFYSAMKFWVVVHVALYLFGLLTSLMFNSQMYGFHKRMELGSYMCAFFHSIHITAGSIISMFDLWGLGVEATWQIFFPQSLAYFVVDLALYAVPLGKSVYVLHHGFVVVGQVSSYCSGTDALSWVAAASYLVEISNPFLHFRYWAKLFGNDSVMYMSGLGMYSVYPVSRLVYFPWVWYQALFVHHKRLCDAAKLTCYVKDGGFGFVFLMSLYFVVTNLQNPKKMFYLKKQKKA